MLNKIKFLGKDRKVETVKKVALEICEIASKAYLAHKVSDSIRNLK